METDMPKNPCKPTRFHYNSHGCNFNGKCILQEGWLASLEGFAVSVAGLFQHICRPYQKQFLQHLGRLSNGVYIFAFILAS